MTAASTPEADSRRASPAAARAVAEDARLRRRFVLGLAALILLLLGGATVAMALGAVRVPLGEVWSIIGAHVTGVATPDSSSPNDAIIWQIRAPRVVLALLVGAGLSITGVAVQAMVRNPLADPYVMGVESGAAAAAVAAIFLARHSAEDAPVIPPTIAAFAGALATIVLVFGIARRGGSVSSLRLLLVGVAVSYALSGVTSFFLYASPDPGAQAQVLFWIMGGLGGAEWSTIPIAEPIHVVGFVAIWYHARPLNALSLGDDSAASLGMRPDRLRTRLLVICALMVATLVPLVGPIGFVGLVVPHIGRLLFGADHRRLIPAAVLLGGLYLLLVDLVARIVFAPSEVPIGVVTSILGAPFFLVLLQRRGSSALGDAR
ncbi:MAG: iron ABC transporter permease [Chloroflexota bacterium]